MSVEIREPITPSCPIRRGVAFRKFRYLTLPVDLATTLQAALPARVVVDGEILVWDVEHGRCSFSLLQQRLTSGRRLAEVDRAYPAHLVSDDLLRDGRGVDLLDQPLLFGSYVNDSIYLRLRTLPSRDPSELLTAVCQGPINRFAFIHRPWAAAISVH